MNSGRDIIQIPRNLHRGFYLAIAKGVMAVWKLASNTTRLIPMDVVTIPVYATYT